MREHFYQLTEYRVTLSLSLNIERDSSLAASISDSVMEGQREDRKERAEERERKEMAEER